jgi:hypothetical protein
MKRILTLALILFFSKSIFAQNNYFFPNKKVGGIVPTPENFLGYPIGSHHTRYDKMVEYMRELGRTSNRVTVQKFGETNGHREQIIVTISSPENLAKLETIRKAHLDLCDPTKPIPDVKNMPVIVWLGYNVHGNEPSGGEAALLSAYYLAASEDEEVKNWLKNAVVMLEPTINPDGRDRHSHWANMNKATPNVTDPNDREHNEVWPPGRTNHYWFDLNRDWYLVQQVESRNRLRFYHTWLPNVVTDHHEMGTNANHFFEPAKENSENDLVPKFVYRDLNIRFAKYFEEAMNEIGSLYGTKELFDNLYPGYGSSYPDIQGGLGLLFEQASSRGHAQESTQGVLTFAFTVRNQLVNAIATVRASVAERETLLKHQNTFYKDAVSAGQKSVIKAYVVGDNQDQSRNKAFWDMLLHHNIEFYSLEADFTEGGIQYKKDRAIIVPLAQAQNLMVRSIFEKQTTGFKDSLFYDASTWNLALSYGLNYAEIKGAIPKGGRMTAQNISSPPQYPSKSNYAYIMEWTDYYAPKALNKLQEKGILVKVSTKPFTIKSKTYGYGTLIIPVKYQPRNADSLFLLLNDITKETGIAFESLNTGYSDDGPDLGASAHFTPKKPQALMVTGTGVNPSEAGEIWHLLDTRVGLPITKVDVHNMARLNLNRYNTIVMVGGSYQSTLDSSFTQKLKGWIGNGNTLITLKSASEWAIKSRLLSTEKLREPRPDTARIKARVNFDIVGNIEGARQTGGSIFETDLDITNPIGYGYSQKRLAIYRNGNTILERSAGVANSVLVYTEKPHISGYVHAQTLQRIATSSAINVAFEGSGRVILFADNPNFRATWYGTNKLFLNALFFGNNIMQPNSQFGSHSED